MTIDALESKVVEFKAFKAALIILTIVQSAFFLFNWLGCFDSQTVGSSLFQIPPTFPTAITFIHLALSVPISFLSLFFVSNGGKVFANNIHLSFRFLLHALLNILFLLSFAILLNMILWFSFSGFYKTGAIGSALIFSVLALLVNSLACRYFVSFFITIYIARSRDTNIDKVY